MLYKNDSPTAREAIFADPVAFDPLRKAVTEAVSPAAREIARLKAENQVLEARLAARDAEWEDALAAAERAAFAAAVQTFRQDDVKRLEVLSGAIAAAQTGLARTLQDIVAPAAASLAETALSRLVTVRSADGDWLARLIARRIDELQANAVVAVRIGPGIVGSPDNDTILAAIEAATPPGTAVEHDPGLAPGKALIDLRFGTVAINPEDGVERLVSLLRTALSSEAGDG